MMRFTILGCGSSGGVPRFGGRDGAGDWGACDPLNPKNRRKRCALLVEKISSTGTTRLCIDAGPDFKSQMIDAKVAMLDALVLTHEHADHVHGIDDVRQFVNLKTQDRISALTQQGKNITKEDYFKLVEEARIDCFSGLSCFDELEERFGYLFKTPQGSNYPPIMKLHKINGKFSIDGMGGKIELEPFAIPHGSIDAFGFKMGGLVYLPDVFDLNEEARDLIRGCDVFIVDCLQDRPHGTHTDFQKTTQWINELKPKHTILTDLHTSLDYDVLNARTPKNVEPAFDGMTIEI